MGSNYGRGRSRGKIHIRGKGEPRFGQCLCGVFADRSVSLEDATVANCLKCLQAAKDKV